MKKAELKVGSWYKINYRKSLKKHKTTGWRGYSYETGYEEKPTAGIGRLEKLSARSSHHLFETDTGDKVYATSHGVISEIKSPGAVGKGCMVATELQKELDKLRNLGLDDESRAREVELTRTLLHDLGIVCKADEENTYVTIDYMSLVNLKFLALTLLKKSMEYDDDADLFH